jgi:hypothetical protein
MAHTFPIGYIPLGDAYAEAFWVMEKPDALLHQINEAQSDEARSEHFDEYDVKERRVERRMRDAIADGLLPLFKKTPNNQIEQILDREPWRQEAAGIPGIDNVAHPLTNPGVDTDGVPVLH